MKVAILDDYQNVSLILGNFEKLKKNFDFHVFNQPFENEDSTIEQLKDFEVLLVMRERTPIDKKRDAVSCHPRLRDVLIHQLVHQDRCQEPTNDFVRLAKTRLNAIRRVVQPT